MNTLVRPSRLNPGGRVDVLFFGESPGRDEATRGLAFVGPAGQLLRDVIRTELPSKYCILDNVCPRYLNGNKPVAREFHEFAEYRAQRIEQCNPRVICLLGQDACSAFGFGKGKITGKNSRLVLIDEKYRTVQSIHPSYVLRSGMKQLGLFQKAFRSVRLALRPVDDHPEMSANNMVGFLHRHSKHVCSFDIETDGLDPKPRGILTFSVAAIEIHSSTSYSQSSAWASLHHPECSQPSLEKALVNWWPRGPRIVHNSKFELAWMRHLRAKDPEVIHDTFLQAWLINENDPKDLDWQVLHVLKKPPYWLGLDKVHLIDEPLEMVGSYNAGDTIHTAMLHRHQRKLMTQAQKRLHDELLSPFAKLLVKVESDGLRCDVDVLKKLEKSQRSKVKGLQKKIKTKYGDINTGSPKQMRTLLYGRLKFKCPIKTAKGMESTGEEAITKLVVKHPEIQVLADLRKAESLLNRVLVPFQKLVDRDSFLHTRLALCMTTTGRLASSHPNLQNVDREGPQRTAMVSRFPGGKIIQGDYAQHEFRVNAARTGDLGFLEELTKSDSDPHQKTCDEILAMGVDIDRPTAKNVNFAVLYMGTEYALNAKYHIPRRRGKELIEAWHQAHPLQRVMYREVEHSLRTKGYSENIFGVRRHMEGNLNDHQIRQAINAEIQGPAAFILDLAMLDLDQCFKKNKMRSVIVLQIHDSIVVDSPRNETKDSAEMMKWAMESVDYKRFTKGRLKHDIPLAVDVKVQEHL